MGLTFKIEGTKELAEALAALGPNMQEIAGGALYQEAEAIMADSKENYVNDTTTGGADRC